MMSMASGRIGHFTGMLALSAVIAAAPVPAVGQEPPPRGPDQISALISDVIDTVVLISTSESLGGGADSTAESPEIDPDVPLDEFFREFFERQEQGQGGGRTTGEGSGFIISEDGLIVTNNHVIEGADGIDVTFNDGRKMRAELVGRDKEMDLAVLRVTSPTPLKVARMGNSDTLEIGEWVVALGNPFGIGLSASSGIVSGRNRDIRAGRYDRLIQTDAAINKGNSGGPLFNLKGEVVGINTVILSPTGGSVGIGFAVPATDAQRVVDQLIQIGEVRRGYLGVRIQDVAPEVLSRVGLDTARGALVAGVTPGSPADEAGLTPGDVILSVDGAAVGNARDLQRAVGDAGADREVAIVLMRDRKQQTVKVRLSELADEPEAAASDEETDEDGDAQEEGAIQAFGGTFAMISDELRRRYKIDSTIKGSLVVMAVRPDTPMGAAGIVPGYVLVELQQMAVRDGDALKERIDTLKSSGKSSVQLLFAAPTGAYRYVTAVLD